MVCVFRRLHTPIEARAKIVLQSFGPAGEHIVAIGRALPGVSLISPVIIESREILVAPVPSDPATPFGMFGIIHAGGNEIEEGHGVALLLPMCRVSRVESAKRTVLGQNVAHQVETSGARGDGRETVVPTSAVQ